MKTAFRMPVASGLVLGLLLANCTLAPTDDLGTSLDLSYRLDRTLQKGEATTMWSATVGGRVKLQNSFVRVSGRVVLPPGASRPRKLVVTAEEIDIASGVLHDRLRVKLEVRREGTFRRIRRLGERVPLGSLVTLTIRPRGAALPAGTETRFCVELAATRVELAASPSCAAAGSAATFDATQQSLFTPTCARGGCHDAATASAELVLEEGVAFGNLVGAPSSQVFRLDRVEGGEPESSYLIKKLRGSSDIMGVRMPLGGPFLSDARIAGIYEWIETGAPDN